MPPFPSLLRKKNCWSDGGGEGGDDLASGFVEFGAGSSGAWGPGMNSGP
jgi:hypothetical protein